MISCVRVEQRASEPPRSRCPVEGSLTVFLVTEMGEGLLVGEPADSDAYVLVPQHSPPMRAAITHIGQMLAHMGWFVNIDSEMSAFEASGRELGIALGPYTGPPGELSVTCHSDWCRERKTLFAMPARKWILSFTIHLRGRPWLYIYQTANYSGVRTTELRTAPPCKPTVIAVTKYPPY